MWLFIYFRKCYFCKSYFARTNGNSVCGKSGNETPSKLQVYGRCIMMKDVPADFTKVYGLKLFTFEYAMLHIAALCSRQRDRSMHTYRAKEKNWKKNPIEQLVHACIHIAENGIHTSNKRLREDREQRKINSISVVCWNTFEFGFIRRYWLRFQRCQYMHKHIGIYVCDMLILQWREFVILFRFAKNGYMSYVHAFVCDAFVVDDIFCIVVLVFFGSRFLSYIPTKWIDLFICLYPPTDDCSLAKIKFRRT